MRWRGWLVISGAAALVFAVAAVVLDAPAFALGAGIAGAAASAVATLAASRERTLADRTADAEHRVDELSEALAAAQAAAAEAAEAAAAAEADIEPGPDVSITDPDTGLFGESFFEVTLTSRVSAARRHLRPVAVVLLEIVEGAREGEPVAADPTTVAEALKSTLRDADTACRLSGGRFGLLLEDTPENGAVWTAERVRRTLAASHEGMTLWAGIACYPAHAFDADELRVRATNALDAAREWRQDRIEVATADVS